MTVARGDLQPAKSTKAPGSKTEAEAVQQPVATQEVEAGGNSGETIPAPAPAPVAVPVPAPILPSAAPLNEAEKDELDDDVIDEDAVPAEFQQYVGIGEVHDVASYYEVRRKFFVRNDR
jgi:hypothetical protein